MPTPTPTEPDGTEDKTEATTATRPDAPAGSQSTTSEHAQPLNETFELAMVLSHYELGIIQGIAEFGRGSSGTPKLLIHSSAGRFVLKRRGFAHGGEDTVRFGHRLQHALISSGFPLPPLIGAKDNGKSAVQVRGRIYELFRYLKAERYRHTQAHTHAGGAALALFHSIARSLDATGVPTPSSYHNNPQVPDRLLLIAERASGLAPVARALAELYEHAAAKVAAIGIESWPRVVLHGDWHPGNLLFDGDRLIGVVDYDTARAGQRALDLGAAALQFSLIGSSPNPADWPAEPDLDRLSGFIHGYESLESQRPGSLISTAELDAMPHLMAESLIGEAIGPIATSGRFGIHEPRPILEMVHRKAQWILENEGIARAAAG